MGLSLDRSLLRMYRLLGRGVVNLGFVGVSYLEDVCSEVFWGNVVFRRDFWIFYCESY